ncbi:MAG TPA: phosphatidylserine decarboxylase [Phycisphaerae bacterium]|nr:phosphatidylserine decarboxylase [Phycisphaerae bacterium]
MSLAREGLREMVVATLVLGAGAVVAAWLWHPAAVAPFVIVWAWVISFFRDPARVARCAAGELCAPADGTVTEITRLDHDDQIGGPALRLGIFLSIFDVHANRSPCAGTVRSVTYRKGTFHDARNARSGPENEANTLLIDPVAPIRGPIVVRQVAGLIARRIICHAVAGSELAIGQRFGMIKFGSRTELIVPDDGAVVPAVEIGTKVRAGLTILVRQRPLSPDGETDANRRQAQEVASSTPA